MFWEANFCKILKQDYQLPVRVLLFCDASLPPKILRPYLSWNKSFLQELLLDFDHRFLEKPLGSSAEIAKFAELTADDKFAENMRQASHA